MQDFKNEHLNSLPKIGGLLKDKLQSIALRGIVVASRRVGSHILTVIETGKDNNGKTIYINARNAKEQLLVGSTVNYRLLDSDNAVIIDTE